MAQCNAYRVQYGTKTSRELAENDPEVRGRYETWQRSLERSKAASPNNSNVVLNQSQRDKANEKYQSLLEQAKNDQGAYFAKLQEKEKYYSELSRACE